MPDAPRFQAAYPFQQDVLALPVTDLDAAAQWYGRHFGMTAGGWVGVFDDPDVPPLGRRKAFDPATRRACLCTHRSRT